LEHLGVLVDINQQMAEACTNATVTDGRLAAVHAMALQVRAADAV
jgi:hypothetical protein